MPPVHLPFLPRLTPAVGATVESASDSPVAPPAPAVSGSADPVTAGITATASTVPPQRRRVALVLGSGGARGYAHIGVIDALTARGYEIVAIAGTSIGAVVGGIHAAGRLDEYSDWVKGIDGMNLLRLLDPTFRLGAIQGSKVFDRIRQMVGDVAIEDLPIEFTAVATDLTNQQEVWFRQGSLNLAMRASAAIPSLFTPVVHEGRLLVDGALLNPLPLTPVLASRSDLIVAVNLNGPSSTRYQLPEVEAGLTMRERIDSLLASIETRLPFRRVPAPPAVAADETASEPTPAVRPEHPEPPERVDRAGPTTTIELINASLEVMQNVLTQYKIAGNSPHVLITVPKRICRSIDFHRANELITMGRRIADDSLDAWETSQGLR